MSEMLQKIRENIWFLLICAVSTAVMLVLAYLCERFIIREKRRVSPARRAAFIGIFSAISTVLMLFDFPVFFAPGFYKFDFSELPVLLCTFSLGPVAGVAAEAVKVVLKVLIKGTSTAFVGDFANFIIGCTLVLPASVIYHAAGRKRSSAIIGLAGGTVFMAIFGGFFNAFYLIPKFAELYGMEIEKIVAMGSAINSSITNVSTLALFAVVPLNLLKGAAVSLVTVLLYPSLERLMHVRASV